MATYPDSPHAFFTVVAGPAGSDMADAANPHSSWHNAANTAIREITDRVGYTRSVDPTSVTYQLTGHIGSTNDAITTLQNVVAALVVFMVEKLGYQPDTQEILDAYTKGSQ